MEFKLQSQYAPTGDQPQAIEKLTENLLRGVSYQTLLGVTGSGKSLDRDELILIYDYDKKYSLVGNFVKIGDFIDKIMRDYPEDKILYHETEIISLPEKYFTLSLNPINYTLEIKPITSFIRHKAPEQMYQIKTMCGREVMVTGDHNFWVLRNGRMTLIPTCQMKNTDLLPLPVEIPSGEKDFSHLILIEYLDKNKFYIINANKIIFKFASLFNKQEIIDFFSNHFSQPYNKLYCISKNINGNTISIKIFQELLKFFSYKLTEEEINELRIAPKNSRRHTLPFSLTLDENFLYFLGYFIAEGHASDKYILISCFDRADREKLSSVFKELNFSYKIRENGDFQISSILLTSLTKSLVGSKAKNKHLPPFWMKFSNRELSILLRAYFEGDGTVEKDKGVVAVTASKELALQLILALFRFGIWARVRKVFKRSTSSLHKGDWYWVISIYGQKNLKAFAEYIGFISTQKIKKVKKVLSHTAHTNVDLIFGIGQEIKKMRRNLNLSQKNLAKFVGIDRSAISMIESNLRNPKKETFQNILSAFNIYLNNGSYRLKEIKTELSSLNNLINCNWTSVASISSITDYDKPYVYDLSVKDNETFLAGGGIFLHNTFTIANVIAKVNKPTLVISHNKTLAAQLYREFKEFFPHNSVEYFVSYYDYYQPEAYIPGTDTYIEKDASINDELDKLRLRATAGIMSRRDVIIVASVSCIYNLGSPEEYRELLFKLKLGDLISREDILRALVEMQYERNDYELKRGCFRAKGEVIEIYPSYEDKAIRIHLEDETVANISEINPLTRDKISEIEVVILYPAKHFVATGERIERALESIENELMQTLKQLRKEGKFLEAQRLESRTRYDMEMLREVGYCHGIENYSRHISGRPPGLRPYCLIDYFPKDFLMIIDESHVTIPQLRGMYHGDRSRKETLVKYGFRLPSCLDNRPLKFKEFEHLINQVIFVSATPANYEIEKSKGQVIEQILRPTGLLEPEITVKPTKGQIEDLISEIKKRVKCNERVLVTTLTKRMAEDLACYLKELGINVHYLHSEIEPIKRVEILRDLRLKKFDCIVGINLLREGLDLPEVSLIAILDADKEGFLRSQTSLIQIAGRAARNINGKVIMYADTITKSMTEAIQETERRRLLQMEYNREHNIRPQSIQKAVKDYLEITDDARELVVEAMGREEEFELQFVLSELYREMELAARNLQFEKAGKIRDMILRLKGEGNLTSEDGFRLLKSIAQSKKRYVRKIKHR